LLFLEPGYYESGLFGLRHENINLVVEAQTKVRNGMSLVWESNG